MANSIITILTHLLLISKFALSNGFVVDHKLTIPSGECLIKKPDNAHFIGINSGALFYAEHAFAECNIGYETSVGKLFRISCFRGESIAEEYCEQIGSDSELLGMVMQMVVWLVYLFLQSVIYGLLMLIHLKRNPDKLTKQEDHLQSDQAPVNHLHTSNEGLKSILKKNPQEPTKKPRKKIQFNDQLANYVDIILGSLMKKRDYNLAYSYDQEDVESFNILKEKLLNLEIGDGEKDKVDLDTEIGNYQEIIRTVKFRYLDTKKISSFCEFINQLFMLRGTIENDKPAYKMPKMLFPKMFDAINSDEAEKLGTEFFPTCQSNFMFDKLLQNMLNKFDIKEELKQIDESENLLCGNKGNEDTIEDTIEDEDGVSSDEDNGTNGGDKICFY